MNDTQHTYASHCNPNSLWSNYVHTKVDFLYIWWCWRWEWHGMAALSQKFGDLGSVCIERYFSCPCGVLIRSLRCAWLGWLRTTRGWMLTHWVNHHWFRQWLVAWTGGGGGVGVGGWGWWWWWWWWGGGGGGGGLNHCSHSFSFYNFIISRENGLQWMPQKLNDVESTLLQWPIKYG